VDWVTCRQRPRRPAAGPVAIRDDQGEHADGNRGPQRQQLHVYRHE